MRKTRAEINLSNLKFNYLNLREKAEDRMVMAVVKADAYGHGMYQCVKALSNLDKKPEYYGVALTEEGVELRKGNLVNEPILTFSPFDEEELDLYLEYDVYPTICYEPHLEKLKNFIGNKKLKVHVNVDTGMGRLGIKHYNAVDFIKKLSGLENVVIDGIYTHFATADDSDKTFAKLQFANFDRVLRELDNEGINYGVAHCSNSGAILDLPETYLEMVRPGISLYGYYPSEDTSESVDLKPVMYLKSEVSTIKHLDKGDSVGYGRIYIAEEETKAATIPIGYADGFNRLLSNKTNAIIKDKLYPQIGRVSMDRILYEIGDDDVKPGDEIIMLGEQNGKSVTAWDWCRILDTIPYEVTCNISKRVPRVYIQ
jgi:alanine racemase